MLEVIGPTRRSRRLAGVFGVAFLMAGTALLAFSRPWQLVSLGPTWSPKLSMVAVLGMTLVAFLSLLAGDILLASRKLLPRGQDSSAGYSDEGIELDLFPTSAYRKSGGFWIVRTPLFRLPFAKLLQPNLVGWKGTVINASYTTRGFQAFVSVGSPGFGAFLSGIPIVMRMKESDWEDLRQTAMSGGAKVVGP